MRSTTYIVVAILQGLYFWNPRISTEIPLKYIGTSRLYKISLYKYKLPKLVRYEVFELNPEQKKPYHLKQS